MGNIYPLSDKPSLVSKTIELIEKSFQYKSPNRFEIDFAPLIDKSNQKNCFILIDENENVLAHIGAKEKNIIINGEKFSVCMLGGIAVDETRRGEGHFQTLFQDVLAEKRSDTAIFLLWSDLEKLYNKFGFHLCGSQFEYSQEGKQSQTYKKTKIKSLSESEKKTLKDLYTHSFKQQFLTLERSEDDWSLLEKIESADLYMDQDSYFFMNKGQDLPGIIYEYGTTKDAVTFLKEMRGFGKVWSGKELFPTDNLQYQFFLSPGDLKHFSKMILFLTNDKVAIRNINLMKQEIYFDFNDETLALDIPEFLRGIFGPGGFEELDLPQIFISGLESI